MAAKMGAKNPRRPSPRTVRAKASRAEDGAPGTLPGTLDDRVIDAALAEAAAVGWRQLTLDGIAARADIALGEVLLRFPTRAHVIARFIARIDERLLSGIKGIDPADSARDRLFDVLMRRFDLLDQSRDGVRAVISGLWRDPISGVMLACQVERSCALMLGAAGISAEGVRGWLRVQGLKGVLAAALRAWLTDDSEDMTKTMAALDRALDRAERLTQFSPPFSSTRRRRAASAE